jgi:outer membrane protein assembly factor BamB
MMKSTHKMPFLSGGALFMMALLLLPAWSRAEDGTQKWAFPTGGMVQSSPALADDGTILVGSDSGKVYAIKPDGTELGTFTIGSFVEFSSPVMAPDGTVYIGSWDGNLYAINPNGTQKWAFPTGDYVKTTPAIGDDGTIYAGSYDANVYAINADGTQKWAFPTGGWVVSSPAVVEGGSIYVGSGDGNLYSINADGTQKWAFPTGAFVGSAPAVGSDGTIYVGSDDFNLYAVNPDGTQKWAFPTGGIVRSHPTIGPDGIIYVGSYDTNLYAVNPDGTQKWAFPTGNFVWSSPAIGPDGTVYIGSVDGNLYAINGSSGGLADSDWPMFHHDLKHTGRTTALPFPNVKANGSDGPIVIAPSDTLSVTVELSDESYEGVGCDWWGLAQTPLGIYHYDLSGQWLPGLAVTHQGPLFDLMPTEILNMSGLPAGQYVFGFGIDRVPDGLPSMSELSYDYVIVVVQ